MKEISKLFQAKDINEIKKLLEIIIGKIENAEYKEQTLLLKEVVKNARKTNAKLRKQCKIDEGLFIYPEIIAPAALLTEEICTDFKNRENMLEVLKFNLNNYFNRFEAPIDNDWHVEVINIVHILQALKKESKFFEVLKLHNINITISLIPARFNSLDIEVINYNEVTNNDFTIHFFYFARPKEDKREMLEICLDQFGIILKNILMKRHQELLESFWDMFEGLEDIDKTDLESNKLTMSFANMFSHYIIEKMIIAIKEKTGDDHGLIEGPRNEALVKRILEYYDNTFEELLTIEKKEEFKDKEKCPCGSGKTYKNCCKKKNMKYYKTEDKNQYTKSVPMSDELHDALMEQMRKFKQLFGRIPSGNDYISGGALYKDVKRLNKLTKRKEIVNKAWLYANEKTDLMVLEDTKKVLSDREIETFNSYMKEYEDLITQEIKDNKCNAIQAVEAIDSILEYLVGDRIRDMAYVLNLFVNFYCENNKNGEDFVIHDMKDFLVFCAYKTRINLDALNSLVDNQYYDSSMAVVRILYEILISIRAYKQNNELFKEKVLSVVGVQEGTHQKVDRNTIEDIETKQRYRFEIQKKQLAEKAGKNYLEIYHKYYRELSEFIHLDTSAAKDMFIYKDMFLELDECLTTRFIGAIFCIQIIKELSDFQDCSKKLRRDITHFASVVMKEFLNVLEAVVTIEDKEIYHILMDILDEYANA